MTATTLITPTAPPATPETRVNHKLWRTGLAAGAAASVATVAFAAVTEGAGVSFKIAGEAIPLPGFAQVTFVATMIGVLLAVVFSHRATHARRTFIRTTLALTAVSFVPDVLADAQASTKVALVLSHIVAAAIVIPMLASRLDD
jgi:Family of unknown function (DUF6069)